MHRALWFQDYKQWQAKAHPGSLYFHPADRDGMVKMDYFCSCGCGLRKELRLKESGLDRNWNGSHTEPTLGFDLEQRCGWKGALKNGYWVAA